MNATPPATGSAPAFSLPIRVYWEDTDAGGIVYHSNYLRFFERARTEWLRSLGLGQRQLATQRGGLFVVADAALRFRAPARLDDELVATARIQSAGSATLVLAQQVWIRPADVHAAPTLSCEGTVRIGWVDAATLRPARIPNELLSLLVS